MPSTVKKKTFEIAEQKGKGLIVQLKENQKELLENCQDLIRFTQPREQYGQQNAEHGRIEDRMLRAYQNKDNFIEDEQWQALVKTIYQVDRKVQKLNTQNKQYETSSETAYYISNGTFSAQQAFSGIRDHWLIENSDHYVRDVAFQEDSSRIRIKADNMARLRSIALNIMRKNNVTNIKGEIYENSLDLNRLYSYKQFL